MENDGTGASEHLAPGTELHGRYRIVRVVGKGGMSCVYEAEHLGLGKRVAIKEMHASTGDAAESARAVQQFQNEARTLAHLEHRYFPDVTDFFAEGERYYLVMEYVDGETMEDLVRRTPGFLAEDTVQKWAAQLCDVLSYLHGQTPPVVFRDLKPSNIMVDNAGQVKLIDFGIARVFKPGKQSDTQSMGTAGYSAPEQYGTGQTDARSDVYSLGAVLHYLLTRRDPTSAPFNFPPVREINPNVSADTERVIERCLRMRPEERFASAADVKAALFPRSLEPETTFLNRQRPAAGAAINPLRATPVVPPPPVRLPPEKQRSWGPVLALIGLILAIAGVGGYLLYAMSRGPDQVVVPDLLGKNQQAAQQALSTQHLSLGIEGYEASTLPVGVVSHQDPQAQSLAQRGQTVSVWLSSGPRMAAVPELAMDTEARAQKDLASAGLKAGQVTHDYSSSVPKGFVITSSPRAGVQLAPGQSVDYVVSDGPKPAPPPPAPAATLTATTTGPNPAPAPPQQPSFSVKIPVPQDGKSHQVTIRVHQADNTDVTAVDTRASSDVDEVVQAPDAHSISATVDGQPVDLTNRVQPMTQSSPASPSGNTTAGGAAGNSGGAPPGSGNPDAAANGSGASAGDNSSAPGAD